MSIRRERSVTIARRKTSYDSPTASRSKTRRGEVDGISGMVPRGMEDVPKYPVLVKGLIDTGYSDGDIRKIMSENLLRVMRASEAAEK